MSRTHCRWGILGTANIARKNWQAIARAGNAVLTAVASRDAARARRFIDECQSAVAMTPAPAACGSYQELIDRKDVDAVYVPLPTAIRKEWVIRAAQAGKHVLCEKPCGVDSAGVQDMLAACRANRVQFMDGVMFMHSGRLPLLRQVLDDGQSVGSVLRITSQFAFLGADEFMSNNIRVNSELEPLGSLGDLGWYNIRLSLWVMKEQFPERVTGRILAEHGGKGSAQPVPIDFSGELLYPGGVSASFFCSFRTQNSQWAQVSGTQGYVRIEDFVLPFFGCESVFHVSNTRFHFEGCDFNMEDHTRRFAVAEYSNSMGTSQEANMIRNFSALVTSGRIEPRWGEQALKTQQVLDACLRSARSDGRPVPLGG